MEFLFLLSSHAPPGAALAEDGIENLCDNRFGRGRISPFEIEPHYGLPVE